MNIEEYQKLNSSFKKKLIYKVGLDCGFFSEYNNMILAMSYCLIHKIQFVLSSNNANFDNENGWCGFFEPFCEDVITSKDLHYKTGSRADQFGCFASRFFLLYMRCERKMQIKTRIKD